MEPFHIHNSSNSSSIFQRSYIIDSPSSQINQKSQGRKDSFFLFFFFFGLMEFKSNFISRWNHSIFIILQIHHQSFKDRISSLSSQTIITRKKRFLKEENLWKKMESFLILYIHNSLNSSSIVQRLYLLHRVKLIKNHKKKKILKRKKSLKKDGTIPHS